MFAEQHRPKRWADVVGQEKVVAKLQALAQRKRLGGRAYWISGQTGTGKTTIGRLIAAELAESWCIHEWDAADLTADAMRELERTMRLRGLGNRDCSVCIVNVVHGLRDDQVRKLLSLLEPEDGLPSDVAFVCS